MRPTWSKFYSEYPDYITYPDSEQVKKMIGGSVDGDWIHNTCAIRMSRGLNYSGARVPGAMASGRGIVVGADGKNYALRVADLRKWFPIVLKKPDFDLKKKAGDDFDKATLSKLKGIIVFDIKFGDATGHTDQWDGKEFSHEYAAKEYWKVATRITLWSLA